MSNLEMDDLLLSGHAHLTSCWGGSLDLTNFMTFFSDNQGDITGTGWPVRGAQAALEKPAGNRLNT